MSAMKAALDRLEQALDRLERAAEGAVGATDEDRERLATELRQTKADFVELEMVAGDVSDQLDNTIERLQRTLDL